MRPVQLRTYGIVITTLQLLFTLCYSPLAQDIAGRNLAQWTQDLLASNETIQLRAAKMIGLFGESAVPQLVEMLQSKNDAVRYWAAAHLGNIGKPARAAVEPLKTAVNDPSFPVRMAINYALSRVDRAGPWYVSLITGVESSDRSTACAAADFFARIGPPATSVLPILQAVFEK